MKRACLVVAVGLLAGGWVDHAAWAGAPSNEEQYWLELINRMRTQPAAELGKLVNIKSSGAWDSPLSNDPDVADALLYFGVDPKVLKTQWSSLTASQPLAWNSILQKTAADHNTQMITYDEQSHQLPNEVGLPNRTSQAGYLGKTYTAVGENVYAYSYSVFYGHAGFAIDWGEGPGGMQNPAGHRDNLMDPEFKEVGIAITVQNDSSKNVGPLVVTQDFGVRDIDPDTGKATNSFITGVIYADAVTQDRFYTPGEGLGSVSVEVRRPGSGTLVKSSVTYASGGYAVQVANGTYDVVISGGALGEGMIYRNVVVNNKNVKLDSLSSWVGGTNTNWTDLANWYGGVPNGPGTVAVLGNTSKLNMQVDAAVTTGTLLLESDQGYTINGTKALTLQAASATGLAAIYVSNNASHNIGAPVAISSDTEIEISDDGAFTLTGAMSIGAGKIVTRKGAGVLEIKGMQSHGVGSEFVASTGVTNFASDSGSAATRNLGIRVGSAGIVNFQSSQHVRRLSVNGGTVAVGSGANKVVVADELLIDGNGLLDLNDNDLIVKATAETHDAVLGQVTDWIKSARGPDGTWQGSGITSSEAGARAAALEAYTGLAVILNNEGGKAILTSFAGEAVGMNDILVKYTWNGDVTLDGKVDGDDYFLVDSGFIGQLRGYRNGDLNFDGVVDGDDYFLMDSAFMAQTGVMSGLGALRAAAVPEPSCAMILAGIMGGLLLRRKRQ
ncbi:MAG: CAP domain-containing protein [Bacillota bacterium]